MSWTYAAFVSVIRCASSMRKGFAPRAYLARSPSAFILAALFICAAAAKAESFDWRNVNGMNFVTSVKNQGHSGMCWAFATVASLESSYMISRWDTSYGLDLSEQQLASAGVGDYWNGGVASMAMNYFKTTGVLRESEVPWTTDNSSSAWESVTATSDWQNRTCKIAGYTSLAATAATIKSMVKANGPLTLNIMVDNEWYDPAPTYNNRGAHSILVIGFADDSTAPGGGYFIIKNSWGDAWNKTGYGKISYATLGTYHSICAVTGAAYLTGPETTKTWTGGGDGAWSINDPNWSAVGETFTTWSNGEDAAVFDGAGGTITLSSGLFVNGVTFKTAGYSLSGGSLTVTGGGITAQESATIDSAITLGGSQTWNVAAGKTLTVNSTVYEHVSGMTINCAGDVILNGGVSDVRSNPLLAGLLTGYQTGLTKSGTGTLTLNTSCTYFGTTTLAAGTLAIGKEGVTLANSTIALTPGAVFNLNSHSSTVGGLYQTSVSMTPTVVLGTGTLTVGGNNSATYFYGNISGAGEVVKIGSAVWTLGGTSAFSGKLTIGAGSVKVISSYAVSNCSTIDVHAGCFLNVSSLRPFSLGAAQTLKGAGTVTGTTVVYGAVNPGDDIGTLTITAATFASGSKLNVDLAGLIGGTSYDVLTSTGTITLLSGSQLNVNLANGFSPSFGSTFDILNYTAIKGTFSSILLPTLSGGLSWDTSSLYSAGVITVVPEPAPIGVLIVACAAGGFLRKIKRNKNYSN